ncbi:unnamed protein product [Rotaria sp. Silwood1]|nr:unnamed protein product [Rotaria sp. Silwood1]CAF4624868.1 unnamed protein product [Rotaria sp. Silwood1]
MAKKAKLPLEVICLSDDDDDDNSKNSIPIATPIKQQNSSTIVNSDVQNDTYESSNWTIHHDDIIHVSELPSKYSDIFKKPFEIRCSTIRFGIVEFNVESDVVLMKEKEFEMKLTGGFLDNVNMKLAYSDVLAFYFSFQSQTPAAFIQVRNEFAVLFDKYIPTSDEHGRGFDPNSKDERRRHVIFYLKTLTPDMERIHISTIYYFLKTKCPKMDVCCVSASRAQELYNLARYAKVSSPTPKKVPFTLNANDLIGKTVGLNNNTIRFDLSSEDLHCLNEGEYLNDNIIDFYLQYIYHEKLSEEDRKRTYLFNSFFYTRLTQKGNSDNSNISAAERRYNRVKRWLRDVDLFSKDYLIVPINQNAHWYIVLIQNPNNVLTEADLISDDEDSDFDDRLKSKKKKRSTRIIHRNEKNNNYNNSSSKSNIPSLEIFDEADEVISSNDTPLKINVESLFNSKNRSQSPAIIIFDSLRIASKVRVAATLREFLQLEYDHKKTLPIQSLGRKLFNIDTIPTIEAAVPQQRNYFDCGLYILQYIESFFFHRSSATNFPSSSTFSNWCEKNLMESNAYRHRRQLIDGNNPNVRVPQQNFGGPVPLNPLNNPNIVISNERTNPQQLNTKYNPPIVASQPQTELVRSRGFYNNPSFQPSPFPGEKPFGWFGTNRVNWVSNRDSELDKNKLAAEKKAPSNNPQANVIQPRKDGGPLFLENLAKQYASKGEKAFPFGQFETHQGRGAVCSNHDNFGGFAFGNFPCPLPASTGMNQLDQYCCGPANYQYCCNAQEYSQTQRGAFGDHRYIGQRGFSTRTEFLPSTKRILAIISPIGGFIVLTGIISLAVLYYKKIRKEQNSIGKPAGAIRLQDDYSAVPQEPPIEKFIFKQNEQ